MPPEELILKAIAIVVLKFELKLIVHSIAIQQNVVELVVQAIAIRYLFKNQNSSTVTIPTWKLIRISK